MAGERLVKAIQTAAKGANPATEKADVLWGTVTSTSPLKVCVENRFEIGEEFLVLSPFCKPFSITIPAHTHKVPQSSTSEAGAAATSETEPAGEPEHTHGLSGQSGHKHTVTQQTTSAELTTIPIWRGLHSGDKVSMLRYANGNSYYILQREDNL